MSDKPTFIDWPVCQQILSVIKAHGGDARFVGGAVRNTLMGAACEDIDMAVNRPIEQVADWLRAAQIAVYETGIAHGTITVRHDNRSVELTQTRIDTQTDGRHAQVIATDDWLEDAKRRDFTVNALYLNADGILFDPLDGVSDVKRGILRFIGEADARIAEDYLRILRGFRLMAEYPTLILSDESVAASARQAHGLSKLSGERITSEWIRLLDGPGWRSAVKLACQAGLDEALFGSAFSADLDAALADGLSALGRFAWLVGVGQDLPDWLRLSRVDTDLLQLYRQALTSSEKELLMTQTGWQQAAYGLGSDAKIRLSLWYLWQDKVSQPDTVSSKEFEILTERLHQLATYQPPTFPLRGADIINKGIPAGPKIGEILKACEVKWVESDFSLSADSLLALVLKEYDDE